MARDQRVMAAAFPVGQERPLFATHSGGAFAVTKNGERFLISEPVPTPGEDEVKVIVNWQASLKN
jgi:hypothetical protein